MHTLKQLVATGAITAMALTVIAMPAAAASKGTVTFVNGIPSTKVDVCIGKTNEIKSGLKYGGAISKQLVGSKAVRFRKAAPGKCKGKVLAGKTVAVAAGSDQTVVATSKAPKVLVFENPGIAGSPAAPTSALTMRHAADLSNNSVVFRRTIWNEPFIKDDPIDPAAATPFKKGDSFETPLTISEDTVMRVKATRVDPSVLIVKAPLVELQDSYRYDYLLVGSKAADAKLLLLKFALDPSPAP